MEYILIILTSITVRTGVPGIATAEFADKEACDAARVALVNRFEATKIGTGSNLETACLPKSSAAAKAAKK